MESYRAQTAFRSSTNHVHRTKTEGSTTRSRKQSVPEPLPRSRTPSYENVDRPWQQMVHTYEWAALQELLGIRRIERQTARTAAPTQQRRRHWEEAAYDIDAQARIWMAEEERRRMAALREAEKTRIVQEEVRRVQARAHQRREEERMKLMEERRRAQDEMRDRERRHRHAVDKAVVSAWRNYETRWQSIPSSKEKLTFRSIPWPLLSPPSKPQSITLAGVTYFLLSPLHSGNQSNKERIKEALRRWHPDRFRRLMSRVPEEEKAAVEEGVGAVARFLNELLSRQGNSSSPARINH